MANVMMNVYKGQRMDVTAQMKDADVILDIFRSHSIRFDKKFTSITGNGPSTITFKGLKAENYHSDLTDMIMDIHKTAKENTIGNVYVKFTSFINPKYMKKKEEPNSTVTFENNSEETDTDDTL